MSVKFLGLLHLLLYYRSLAQENESFNRLYPQLVPPQMEKKPGPLVQRAEVYSTEPSLLKGNRTKTSEGGLVPAAFGAPARLGDGRHDRPGPPDALESSGL